MRAIRGVRTALAGMAVLVVVCVAAPAALVAVAALAWPHGWQWSDVGLARVAVLVVDLVGWMSWLAFVVDMLGDVVRRVRRRDVGVVGVNARERAGAWLAGLVLMCLPAVVVAGGQAGASPLAHRPAAVAVAATATPTVLSSGPATVASAVPASPSTTAAAAPSPTAEQTYTVQNGDCLSSIAERLYGTAGMWQEIWTANADAVMATGERFTDPNLILVGWHLVLPGVVAEPTSPQTAAPPEAATPPQTATAAAPVGPASATAGSSGSAPNSGSATGISEHAATVAPGADGPEKVGGRPDWPPVVTHRGRPNPPAAGSGHPKDVQSDDSPESLVEWVPEAAAVGVSVVLIAALMRRRRRGRLLARAGRGDDEVVVDIDEPAVAFESRTAAFVDAPVLDWLEVANRHLTAALRAEGRTGEAPDIHLVRVGPEGVYLFLAQPVEWSPGAFELVDDGLVWRLGSWVDRQALWDEDGGDLAWLPLLVPVGDDLTGTYLLHLAPGDAVSVEGPGAAAMLRSWRAAATAWPWAEQVPVVTDAEGAEREVVHHGYAGQVGLDERGTVLYVGDSSGLSPLAMATAARAGEELPGAPLRVVATETEAVIDPYEIIVRPCALDPEAERALASALDNQSLVPSPAPSVPPVEEGGDLLADLVPPGPVEIRLLTFTPILEGLAAPLPRDRLVRITELVAWIAIHGDRGTTVSAMLDHGIAGAASEKTIYNIVSAARRALGEGPEGSPRLVTDRSTGVYRVSEEVTVDVLRFEAMAEAGISSTDAERAAVLCDAALQLIEDTPVGNGSGRYGWWSAMWEARLGRLATKAARRLTELAVAGQIDVDVARAGLERARLVAIGEEELARAAMTFEAAIGDRGGVEREFALVAGNADALEPGNGPSEATEALYAAIRRRWREGERTAGAG
jgi:DNA-binding SARP family transcriptional activator